MVIGTSAGGLEALGVVLEGLPSTYRPPIPVVQHVPAHGRSQLVEIFARRTRLRVKEAEDKDPLSSGMLCFAAPGYHLLVEGDRSLSLSRDDAVHFRGLRSTCCSESAADVWGRRWLACC